MLWAEYPGILNWEWTLPNPYRWNVWLSWDNGASWVLVEDYWTTGDDRDFWPDGGSPKYFIVGVDANGIEITGRSNIVRPDDAPTPPTLATDLVAHFGMDELSGDRVDDVGGFILAPMNGSVAGVAGLIGNAAAFDGAGGYFGGTVDTTAFSPTANGFTISLWANFSTMADPFARVYLASVWDDGIWPAGSPWNISVIPGDEWVTLEIVGLDAGFAGDFSFTDMVSPAWVHFCVVFDPAVPEWALYVRGERLFGLGTDDYWQTSGRLGIGAHTNPITPPPDFMVDEVAVWGRALTASEVGQLYNNGNGLAVEDF